MSLRLLAGLFLLLAAQVVGAADISVRNPQLTVNDDGYSLAVDFNINFNRRLEETVAKGVPLYFTVEFELNRSRWYWLDEHVIRRSRTYQLSYHALTRQYRVSTGALHQSFPSLDEALGLISRLRHWQVLEKGEVNADLDYQAGVRMRLDLNQMPKTFQVTALANKDWNLASDWRRWDFAPEETSHVPASPSSPSASSSSSVSGTSAAPSAAPNLVPAPAATERK